MKVTQVAIRPTPASELAGRPALTPELLAASGARYSRNNDGLQAILDKIDPSDLDKSVDGIFKMLDYGHASIADLAPVAIFIDGVSLWLAYWVWTLCPTAGGQESSTRYLNYGQAQNIDADALGIAPQQQEEWRQFVGAAFENYARALELWESVAHADPSVMRLDRALLEDPSERAQKQVARMRRNYAFDRARNYLPACAPTNLMLVMSARAWAILCSHLLSHPNREARDLGDKLRDEMALAAPRLLKHAAAKTSLVDGLCAEAEKVRRLACASDLRYFEDDSEHPPTPHLDVLLPNEMTDFAADLQFHDNRYAWMGDGLRRTSVRFSWDAVAFAEIRDLNRHRTGSKWCPLAPRGFYAALDQIPTNADSAVAGELHEQAQFGRQSSRTANDLLQSGDSTYVYWTLLGTQYPFEHTTTADKFLYEAELRTGVGAHFRYAKHLRDALALWYERFPATRGLVLEGSAEPE